MMTLMTAAAAANTNDSAEASQHEDFIRIGEMAKRHEVTLRTLATTRASS